MGANEGSGLKVLSVVGAGRSGTTVMAQILGEIEGFASAGELRWLWERGVRDGRPCGCGKTPTDCPVWSPVIAETLDALSADGSPRTLDGLIAAQHQLARGRNLPRTLRSAGGGQADWAPLRVVRAATGMACAAFAGVTGARVVVDTSKRPVDAAVLAGVGNVDLYVLHLVRDPRAVVHSWRRAKTFTAEGQTRTMGTRGLASSVRRWNSNALSAEALRRRIPPSHWLHLRYEDFAANPRSAIEGVVRLVGEPARAPFEGDHTVALRPNHIVAGNPSRFTTGSVTIRSDDEWKRALSGRDQGLVALATMPLMLRYGYAVRHG